MRKKTIVLALGSFFAIAAIIYLAGVYPPPASDELGGTAVSIDQLDSLGPMDSNAGVKAEMLRNTIAALEYIREDVFMTTNDGNLSTAISILEEYQKDGTLFNRGERIDVTLASLESIQKNLIPLERHVNIKEAITALEDVKAGPQNTGRNIDETIELLRGFDKQKFTEVEQDLSKTIATIKDFRRNRSWKPSREIETTINLLKNLRDWNPQASSPQVIATLSALRGLGEIGM